MSWMNLGFYYFNMIWYVIPNFSTLLAKWFAVAYFQPSFLIYSTANEQVWELKQIIIITNQWSVGLRWIIFNY